jgi:hypothetical protein
MCLSGSTQGKSLNGRDDRAVLNFCEQLVGDAL